jgi:hypothetical protein
LREKLSETLKGLPSETAVEIWFSGRDAHRPKERLCAPVGEPRPVHGSHYLFGRHASARYWGCPRVPFCRHLGHQRYIDEISRHVSPGAITVVLTDNASWHKAKALIWPANIHPPFVSAGCPEFDAQENTWQYMHQTWLSLAGYAVIINSACDAWTRLLAEAGGIASIATRDWVLEALVPP